jgi:5-deoxy-glucuronate isomerase
MTGWHRAAGSAADDGYPVAISPESAGWGFSGLRILDLAPGRSRLIDTGENELVVLPLAGSCMVEAGSDGAELRGRESVFAEVSDFAYVPRDASLTISSSRGGRFALASARARRRLPFRHVAAKEVPVELRGTGSCSRQVNNLGTPDVLDADRLIVCEVLTPAGNWSSYPPHKHDEQREGEAQLEEVYYFEVAAGPAGEGIGFQRVYSSGPGKEIDVCAEVRSGDTVLIPHGWHGPSMAAPGYDLYYLNVMGGPSPERAWLICDDPAHTWVRGTWDGQEIDPRLPLTTTEEK